PDEHGGSQSSQESKRQHSRSDGPVREQPVRQSENSVGQRRMMRLVIGAGAVGRRGAQAIELVTAPRLFRGREGEPLLEVFFFKQKTAYDIAQRGQPERLGDIRG